MPTFEELKQGNILLFCLNYNSASHNYYAIIRLQLFELTDHVCILIRAVSIHTYTEKTAR